MYFMLEGKIGVGFMMNIGVTKKQYTIVKQLKTDHLICDHYVVNNKRSEFIFKIMSNVKCFALTKKFLLKSIFPKYPEIASKMKADAMLRYRHRIRDPVYEEQRKAEEKLMKKNNFNTSTYNAQKELNQL